MYVYNPERYAVMFKIPGYTLEYIRRCETLEEAQKLLEKCVRSYPDKLAWITNFETGQEEGSAIYFSEEDVVVHYPPIVV